MLKKSRKLNNHLLAWIILFRPRFLINIIIKNVKFVYFSYYKNMSTLFCMKRNAERKMLLNEFQNKYKILI